MTFENALKRIKTAFLNVDATKLADMAVQVTLTDEDCGGTLYFKSESGQLAVEGYDYRDNDVVMDIQRKAFMDVLSGKTDIDKAIEKGQATVKGDFEKLSTLKVAVPVYKAPARKPAAKKAEPAKKAVPVKKTTVKKSESVKKTTAKKTVKKA